MKKKSHEKGAGKMTLKITEIDGSIIYIDAIQDDSAFLKTEARAYNLCTGQGIHIYKGENGIHYLVDSNGDILAHGLAMIKTYIKYFILNEG